MPPATGRERPKNREVENEMIKPPASKGEPPRPATQPSGDSTPSGEPARPGKART